MFLCFNKSISQSKVLACKTLNQPMILMLLDTVKSGNFGHHINSDIHLQTVENQIKRLLVSRLTRMFTVCLVKIFF